MIRRLLMIFPAVKRALKEFCLENLIPTKEEQVLLQNISDVLETIECDANELSSNNMDLGKADKVLEFMFHKLQQNESNFSRQMFHALSVRIKERRNSKLSGLLRLLSGEDLEDSTLDYPSRSELISYARDMYMKLFFEAKAFESTSTSIVEDIEEPKCKKSRAEELKEFLSPKTKSGLSLSTSNDVLNQLRREFSSLQSTGERPLLLEKIFKALKGIPPTSAEAERVFSAAGLFVTKLRSRLSDRSIDDLCFLRRFFLNKK